MDVRMLTVGPLQENCFLVRPEGSSRAVIVDPGDQAEDLLAVIGEFGITLEAILLTHCHFDHVGAVAQIARETDTEVWVPRVEAPMLADVNNYVFPGYGPFESYDAENMLDGGERLELAGLEIDVLSTPGHSPGHVSYAVRAEKAVFSGDVLFQGSVGRTDLPGADAATLMNSIRLLLDELPEETVVHPGHMGQTTLGAERASNPFLTSLVR